MRIFQLSFDFDGLGLLAHIIRTYILLDGEEAIKSVLWL